MNFGSEPTPKTASAAPAIQGGSTIGIKYNGGILLGSDRMLKYAGCYWIKDLQRINQISSNCLLASSGDYADLQQILKKLKDKRDLDVINEDGEQFLEPKDYCKWLANLQFGKRMRVDPYWNNHIVAGIHSKTGEKFLGIVDMYGNNFEGKYLLTGIANYFCNAILEKEVDDNLSLEEAKRLMDKCFTTLYYRDKFQGDVVQYATISDSSEITLEEPHRLDSKWDYHFTKNLTNDTTRDMKFYM